MTTKLLYIQIILDGISWISSSFIKYYTLLLKNSPVFRPIWKKIPDVKLKLCYLYLAVVIFRTLWGKKLSWTETIFSLIRFFSALYGKKISCHGTETMFPISRCFYFPPFKKKNSLTWNWNYVPSILMLLFSAQYGKKFPDMELKLWSFISLLLFSAFYGKKFPDMELKLCSLYLAVVIFRTLWGKKFPDMELKLCSLYLAVVIFHTL